MVSWDETFQTAETGAWDSVLEEVLSELSKSIKADIVLRDSNRSLATPLKATIETELSIGEFIDKITILKIKSERIQDPDKLQNISKELDALQTIYESRITRSNELDDLIEELLEVNKKLWGIEDAIREKERKKRFDAEFIELARSVYFSNDLRANTDRPQIIKEEKPCA